LRIGKKNKLKDFFQFENWAKMKQEQSKKIQQASSTSIPNQRDSTLLIDQMIQITQENQPLDNELKFLRSQHELNSQVKEGLEKEIQQLKKKIKEDSEQQERVKEVLEKENQLQLSQLKKIKEERDEQEKRKSTTIVSIKEN